MGLFHLNHSKSKLCSVHAAFRISGPFVEVFSHCKALCFAGGLFFNCVAWLLVSFFSILQMFRWKLVSTHFYQQNVSILRPKNMMKQSEALFKKKNMKKRTFVKLSWQKTRWSVVKTMTILGRFRPPLRGLKPRASFHDFDFFAFLQTVSFFLVGFRLEMLTKPISCGFSVVSFWYFLYILYSIYYIFFNIHAISWLSWLSARSCFGLVSVRSGRKLLVSLFRWARLRSQGLIHTQILQIE